MISRKFLRQFLNLRLFMAFVMGISAGLPLLMTITLMQAWAKEAHLDLETIGMMSLVGLPYTIKFLWAPIFDRFNIKVLGRRRGWLMILQSSLCLSVVAMAYSQPAVGGHEITYFVVCATLVAFFSATQDTVIDAFRREDLRDEELGIGSSYYIYGYRIGMIVASSGGLILSDFLSWREVYLILAGLMLVMILATYLYHEPPLAGSYPKTLKESVVEPFLDYFKKDGSILILAFTLLYKLGDTMGSAMTTPFYLELGYSKTEIGSVVKLFGFWATMLGSFFGGAAMLKIGIKRALWIFGFLQMFSTACFAILVLVPKSLSWLAAVIAFENLSAGMGTAAFVAFMASMTNAKYTATQYALLSSLMGVPRVVASAMTGYMITYFGWFYFYIICAVLAVPGLLILLKFKSDPKDKNHGNKGALQTQTEP